MALGLVSLPVLTSCFRSTEAPLRFVEVLQIRQGPSKGSGTVVEDSDCQSYFLITNHHVVPRSTSVEASLDGKHLMLHSKPISVGGELPRDLAFIRLESSEVDYFGLRRLQLPRSHWLASLKSLPGESARFLSVGYPIRPFNSSVSQSAPAPAGSDVLSSSRTTSVSATTINGSILKKLSTPLRGGYDLVISHDLEQGMSGGALLDDSARLIGINAMHALPAWDSSLQDEAGITMQPIDHQFVESRSMAISLRVISESIRPYLPRLCGRPLD